MRLLSLLVICLTALAWHDRVHAESCAPPRADNEVPVPGRPFAIASTSDGCWVFATLAVGKDDGAVAVLHNRDGAFEFDHAFALKQDGRGVTLSHNGQNLFAVVEDGVIVLDATGLERGNAQAMLGKLDTGRHAGSISTAITADDRWLFVSNEDANTISVFDLTKMKSDKALVGHIPMTAAPVGLALSPDGRWLYATSEATPKSWMLPATCKPEMPRQRVHPPGVLFRIDVDKATADPSHSAVGAVPAGCSPVRVAVSPSGKELWVTARGENALLRFEADTWLEGAKSLERSSFNIGSGPVGVAARPDGKQVWVALSNRFGGGTSELAGLVVDGQDDTTLKRLSLPAAGFPREVTFLPDGRTLVATLFQAQRVKFVLTPP